MHTVTSLVSQLPGVFRAPLPPWPFGQYPRAVAGAGRLPRRGPKVTRRRPAVLEGGAAVGWRQVGWLDVRRTQARRWPARRSAGRLPAALVTAMRALQPQPGLQRRMFADQYRLRRGRRCFAGEVGQASTRRLGEYRHGVGDVGGETTLPTLSDSSNGRPLGNSCQTPGCPAWPTRARRCPGCGSGSAESRISGSRCAGPPRPVRHQCPTGRRKRQTRWPSDAGTDETCDDSWDKCERPQGREFQLPATERNGTERNG